ncbi:hypothetical protein [Streptomyces sp. NPDC088760]|uniref:hypothetical protein n=1 Tax=Streptomyces sp. NPDC088760 TaxID=3365890 RepID=UPI0037FEE6C2
MNGLISGPEPARTVRPANRTSVRLRVEASITEAICPDAEHEPVAEPTEAGRPTGFPAGATGQSGIAFGAPPVADRPQHKSMSHVQANTMNQRQP